MVESQQNEDNNEEEDEVHDLDNYLRSEYLDNCDLYNTNQNNKETEDNESNNSNNPASPANSTYSRPVSRYIYIIIPVIATFNNYTLVPGAAKILMIFTT